MPDLHQHIELSRQFENVLGPIIQVFMEFMKEKGLTMPQVHALMYIYHAGECRISEIGTLADSSVAAASQMAERLVQQGLIERNEDPANRRNKTLRLSEKGRALILESVSANHVLAEKMASLRRHTAPTVPPRWPARRRPSNRR